MDERYGSVDMKQPLTYAGYAGQTNSPLFQVLQDDGDTSLVLRDNLYNPPQDDLTGKVALLGESLRDYRMSAQMKFLGHHLEMPRAGWFGFVIRAKDTDNYELIWFMPEAEESSTVAYVPVAHGLVPWWTEAYATQQKGGPPLPRQDWFEARVEVVKDEVTVFVNGGCVFTKKLTYYLREGRPGFYVGTGTDAAFKDLSIEALPASPD
jgi:hypothetical protein